MNTPQLPERPDLEQLKRQAKELLRAARAGNSDALARLRALPAFARRADDAIAESVALHDAQSTIARELGFASWKALVERVEELTLEFSAAVDEFVRAATEVQPDRAERLLSLYPRIAGASFYTALLLGDVDRIDSHLADRPSLATDSGGTRNWPGLLYVCHTSLKFGPATRATGLVAGARRLLALGADPNARFPWLHHGVRRPALWAAVCVVRLLPLAELLLDAGADPNDGVTFPLAAGGGDIASLELLHRHGADLNQPWATDGASTLYSILNWTDTDVGVQWLLDHGADPDPVFAPNGETPLHVVARRGSVEVAESLVKRGADAMRPRADGRTPYAVAVLSGNHAVAGWLREHDASTELSDVDQFVAACGSGDREAAHALIKAHPELPAEIGPEHYAALYRAAERGDANALESMLGCGFDPNRADEEIGKTALHAASHEGWRDAVRTLLAHGASVLMRDREFHGTPLVWAADGQRTRGSNNGRDFDAVGQLLLAAGSPTEWESDGEPAQEIVDIIREWRAARDG